MASETISLHSIGVFHSSQVHPYEAGRQPDSLHAEGVVELFPGSDFEQALIGLEAGSRIWLVFLFHHNPHWNPMVLPPRGSQKKVGVFATRSPYRPNPLGLSCVEILRIEKLKIYVAGADLLDGSPILDIKPYLASADSFPGEEPGWLASAEKFQVQLTDTAEEQLKWLESQGLSQLRGFLFHQLEYEPGNHKKKRVRAMSENLYILAYRTWRAEFSIYGTTVTVERIFSGYSTEELADISDPYQDKNLHRNFNSRYPTL